VTTTLSIHTKEADPDQAFDSLKKAMALIEDLRAIPGLRVIIHGDLQVDVIPIPFDAEPEKTRLIKDIRRMLPVFAIGHPELATQIEDAMKRVEAETA
jgi:hypothetical protein